MDEQKPSTRTDCYTYIEGVGFTQPNPFLQERRALKHYATGLGWALLAALLFAAVFPFYFLTIAKFFDPAVRFYNNQVVSKKAIFYLAGTVSYLLAFALPFAAFYIFHKIPRKAVFPTAKVRLSQVVMAIGLGLGVAVAGAVCGWLFTNLAGLVGIAPIAPDFSISSKDIPSAVVMLTQVLLIAPLLEEFVFRGVILGTLRRFGDGFAIVTSAILFGLVHRNMVQLPNAFLCGLIMAYAVVRSGSIWVSVAMHLCNNILAMGMSVFAGMDGGGYMVGLITALMVLAGIAGLIGLLGSQTPLWVTRPTGFCGREQEKYQIFFSQPTQIACLVLMLASVIRNFQRI